MNKISHRNVKVNQESVPCLATTAISTYCYLPGFTGATGSLVLK